MTDRSEAASLLAQARELGAVLSDLNQVSGLLGWDQQTLMPQGAASQRGNQIATVQTLLHDMITSPKTASLVRALTEVQDQFGHTDRAMIRELRREHERATRIPARLVVELAHAQSEGVEVWTKARADNDFASFAPILRRLVALSRERAEHLSDGQEPYDALHDEFEPGSTSARVQAVFEPLRVATMSLLDRIRGSEVRLDDAVLRRTYRAELQEKFGREQSVRFGFDYSRGRLDRSVHPFAEAIGRDDVRITTRYDENFLSTALYGILHETGHGLYEQGVAPELRRTLLEEGTSMAVHESQSRLWENLVGRSEDFWHGAWPRLAELFPDALDGVTRDAFVRASNVVRPDLIRVEADEVTYNLHIMIRFELERDLISGKLDVADLPEAWNTLYLEYLGVEVPDDARGCLQDVHWAAGLFGYFPSYAIGNLMSVQFMQAARAALPDLSEQIRAGEFSPLRDWLASNIYRHGKTHEPLELLERVTGKGLDAGPYISYLEEKFGTLYGVKT